jgi:hypothetical protein
MRRTRQDVNSQQENGIMRRQLTTAILAATLAVVPCGAFAAQSGKPAPAAKHSAATKPAATHATMGVVKSVNDNQLVITRTGKNASEMSFDLTSATQRKGSIAVGSTVSVRYRDEGTAHMATAITAQAPKHKGSGDKH